MFQAQSDAAHSALASITKPTSDAIDALVSAAESAVTDLQASVDTLNAQVADLTSQLQVATSGFSTDEAKVADLTNKLNAASTQLATAQSNLSSVQGQLNILISQFALVPPEGFADMQMHGDWKANYGTDQKIGPFAPGTTFNLTQFVQKDTERYAMQCSIQGVAGQYSDILWAIHRRVFPTAKKRVIFRGKIYTDANTPNAAQCIEIDTMYALGGTLYNLSHQINYNKGGMLQFSSSDGMGWLDSGIIVGKLTPGVWHTFEFEDMVDSVAKTRSYVAFTLDGKRYEYPASAQNLAPVTSNWSDGVTPQLQLDTNSKGIGFTCWFSDLSYSFTD